MKTKRNIKDFFSVEWQEIIAGRKITFDVYIYFEKSSHVLRWRHKNETINLTFIERYHSRGLNSIWIHNKDRSAYLSYKNPIEKNKTEEHSTNKKIPTKPKELLVEPPPPKTNEGALIAEVLNDHKIDNKEKEELVKAAAEEIINEIAQAETKEEQETVNEKAKEIVKDILNATTDEAKNILEEIWDLADLEPDLSHSLNVSTYSVIYAMAFGKIAPDLLADIALAGLLHDLGLSQIPITITRLPWSQMTDQNQISYRHHVNLTKSLLDIYAPEVSERAKAILVQQHEKFDGTGYPNQLQGFQFDDIAQLVAMAELTDSISSGQWDGKERTLKESFDVLDSLDKQRSFPEYFNPDIFARVIKWFRSPDGEEAFRSASDVVQSQFKSVVDQEEGSPEKEKSA